MKHKRLNRDGWGFQYYRCDLILNELCSDIIKTNTWCAEVREIVEKRIASGEKITKCREVLALEK